MPDAPELNLDSILGREKQPELSKLDPDFYDKVADKVAGLISELEADSIENEDITDQLEVTKRQVMEIIQARTGKIIRIASSQSVKRNKGDAPALTQEERKLYNALLDLCTEWWRDFDRLFRRMPKKKPENQEKPYVPNEEKKKIRDVSGYIMVRLLITVPPFVGFDNRNYTLAKEDVAMVPGVNAKALIARKAAVRVGKSKN